MSGMNPTRQGMRMAIGLKRDQIAEVVINQLYKHTNMQTSFGIIFLAVVKNRPELLSLKEILNHFISHRANVIIRRTRYDLRKAEETGPYPGRVEDRPG